MAARERKGEGATRFPEAWAALLGRVRRDLAGLRGSLDGRVHHAMVRLRLPSRAEVVDLGRRLASLSRRVEELERRLAERRRRCT